MTFFMCSRIMRRTKHRSELRWAYNLTSMLQLSLVAYAVGGAFLGLAYYDLYYHIVAITIITHSLVKKALAEEAAKTVEKTPAQLWQDTVAVKQHDEPASQSTPKPAG